jgi:hypothetical protein
MEAIMKSKITIKCECGREVVLELIAGQYQDEYQGDCKCGRKWFLKELTEALAEISDC